MRMRSAALWFSALGVALAAAGRVEAFSGSEGASFLDIPVGGRPAAMGSAYSAIATDSYAPVWNPAGLGLMKRGEASLMHLSYLQSMSYETITLGVPLKNGHGVGGAVQYFRPGSQNATDAAGNSMGEFGGHYMAASLGYGYSLSRISLGVTGRVVNAQIAGVGATALAADLGAMAQVAPRLRLGLVAANLGSRLKFLNESDPLPAQLRLGAALDVTPKLVVALEGVRAFHSDDSVHLGTEWRPLEPLALRAGYRSDVTREAGDTAGFTLGTGLSWQSFTLDYAWVPLGHLGHTQYFSVAMRFGGESDNPQRMGGGSIIVLP